MLKPRPLVPHARMENLKQTIKFGRKPNFRAKKMGEKANLAKTWAKTNFMAKK